MLHIKPFAHVAQKAHEDTEIGMRPLTDPKNWVHVHSKSHCYCPHARVHTAQGKLKVSSNLQDKAFESRPIFPSSPYWLIKDRAWWLPSGLGLRQS